MKVIKIFEGTEEQFKNMEFLLKSGNNDLPEEKTELAKREVAKKYLESEGYFTDNLWQIEDAQSKFKCNAEEAQELLSCALTNDATMEQIWFAMDYHGGKDDMDLTPVDDD